MSADPNLLLLLSRPQESIALTKGQAPRTQFLVSPNYVKDSFRPFANEILEKSGENADEYVTVKQIEIPSLKNIMQLPKEDAFSLFFPKHQKLAGELLEIFLAQKDPDDLLAVAIYVRERVNPYLFQYAFSVALLHRPDTQNLELPSLLHSFPEKFFHSKVIGEAKQHAALVPAGKRKPIDADKHHTASKDEIEQKLHYFREDIGVSLHHWTWHLVYPTRGPDSIINKNRRGEMFYYMHKQILARYDYERFSNNLRRTKAFTDLDAPMEEGYAPKLDRMLINRSYPPRMPNQKLLNLRRYNEGLIYDVNDLKVYRDNIISSIDSGFVYNNELKKVPLDDYKGIDVLGNIIESTALSPNEELYGNIHNIGHSMISLVHDPDGRHLEQFSVMGGTATAARDPMFYRWHGLMEMIFTRFKNKLPKYTYDELNFPGIIVEDIEINTPRQNPNILRTFWSKSTVNIADGIDFQNGGDLKIRFSHLQHADFTYKIIVRNNTGKVKEGMCRIYMSPKYDEDGKPWDIYTQRSFLIELDRFKVVLKPGKNEIIRSSVNSAVTIPFEQTYRDLTQLPKMLRNTNRFCGCGWPHNLLIPRGKPEGLPSELFVMISDYDIDKVVQDVPVGLCKDAISFCGLKDKMYPDRRSMGFPFDRLPRDGVKTLKEFMTPNMNVKDVSIIFEDKVYLNKNRME